ncbi:MAG: translocator protein [Mycobacterium sp.]|nr:translocator protein [Mycobacterium sp.]
MPANLSCFAAIRDIGFGVKNWVRAKILVSTVGAVFASATLGGLASRPAQSAWYARLKKPSFQPPRQAFPIVWPILYADIAVVSASTLDHLHDQDREQARTYGVLLAANLVLNAGWTWLFFTRRQLGASALAAAALTASSADLTRRAVAARGASGAALGLYPAWCAFATLLSTGIWQLNRDD